jgi:hypothetical protein
MYPYPNMVLDSYYYILAAITHANVSPWAIGYSWFLRLFGIFSHSPLLLVIFQYLLLEASLLIFFLTLTTFFTFSRTSKWILFVFFFANPLLLYCANFVMADALFISLSIYWVTLLIWMVFKPHPYLLSVHTALMLAVFMVRYNALYYPFVATLALYVSQYSWRQKAFGVVLQILVIGGFILYTSIQIGTISGKAQFSPFGNWKLANDALYMYGHIYLKEHGSIPSKFAILDHMARQSFEISGEKTDDLLDYESPFYGSIYMFANKSPLVRYEKLLYGSDTEFVNFKKMSCVGPLYGQYGSWLIRQHPLAFAQYFVVPNAVRYFYPPMEAFASLPPFFLRPDYLGDAARKWFEVKTLTVRWPLIQLRSYILTPYQTMMGIIHLLFVVNLIAFFTLKGYRLISKSQLGALTILVGLWLCDLVFNLIAAATVMRYEIFLLIIEFSLTLWLIDHIYFTRSLTNNRWNKV